jgi:nucleotide-binding universal stress UspA family protein
MTTDRAAAIVVGVDGSPHSVGALDWAARDAVVRQRPLRIVHAFTWPVPNALVGLPTAAQPDVGLRNAAERLRSSSPNRPARR